MGPVRARQDFRLSRSVSSTDGLASTCKACSRDRRGPASGQARPAPACAATPAPWHAHLACPA